MKISSIVAYGIILCIFIIVCIPLLGDMKNNKKPSQTNEPIKTKAANNVKSTSNTNKPIKKKEIDKNTMAHKAYEKLKTDNMIDEDFITVIYVLQEIDENVRSVNLEKNVLGYYNQTFEFSDESKIKLSKKEKKNGDFRFIPYATRVLE